MFNIKVSEGKYRLRLLISSSLAIGVYVYLVVEEYRLNKEEIFFVFPLLSILAFFVVYVFITLFYWVLEGFEKDNLTTLKKPSNNSLINHDIQSLVSSYIRRTGNQFDTFCTKNAYSQLFQYTGPFYAWSILQLALKNISTPDDKLNNLTIESLNRVVKINHEHTIKAVDGYMSKKSGAEAIGFAETGKLVGIDLNRMFNETNDVFVNRLDKAINTSLDRIQSDSKNKFVPILDILMARKSNSGTVSEFDKMNDDEYEYIFIAQCVENFTIAKKLAYKISQEYRQKNTKNA